MPERQPLTISDLKDKTHIPVCPAVLTRLTRILASDTDSVSDLWSVLRSDPGLTARVLGVANSAYFGSPRKIHTVEEAVLRIGFRTVWSVAATVVARDTYGSHDQAWAPLQASIWQHSMCTAACAHGLGMILSPLNSDTYFTAGLLHDIGKLVLNGFDPGYAEKCWSKAGHSYDLVWLETETYGTHHAKLGGELLQYWGLPNDIATSVALHHEPPTGTGELLLTHRLLAAANEMAHAVERRDSEAPRSPAMEALLQAAGIRSTAHEMVWAEAHRMLCTLQNA